MPDTKKELLCPACGEVMKKVFITETQTNVDICTEGCGGIWFDSNEDKFYDEANENIDEILAAYTNKVYKQVNQEYDRYCPICGTKLRKTYTSVKREVQVDECLSCGGKFFDYKELEAMRNEYKTEKERSAASLKQAYNIGELILDDRPAERETFWGWLVSNFTH